MELEAILIILALGAIAGWLAGLIMKGTGFGLIGDIVIGIIGAFVGQYLFGALGISIASGLINSVITATIGAVALLFVIGIIKKIL